jgi:hypothetical protein
MLQPPDSFEGRTCGWLIALGFICLVFVVLTTCGDRAGAQTPTIRRGIADGTVVWADLAAAAKDSARTADSLWIASGIFDFDDYLPNATTIATDTLRAAGTLRGTYLESNDANTGGETDTLAVIDANGIIKKGNHPLSDVGSGSGGGYVAWADRDTLEFVVPLSEGEQYVEFGRLWTAHEYQPWGLSDAGVLRRCVYEFPIPGGLGTRDTCEAFIVHAGNATGNILVRLTASSWGPGDQYDVDPMVAADSLLMTHGVVDDVFADTTAVLNMSAAASTDTAVLFETVYPFDRAAWTAGNYILQTLYVRIY